MGRENQLEREGQGWQSQDATNSSPKPKADINNFVSELEKNS